MSQWPALPKLVDEVKSGKVTATELVDRALAIIESKKDYNAVLAVTDKRAKQRATEIDENIKNGNKAGRLLGVPFIVKDNLLTFGSETTAASNILKGFNAPYQSTAIEKIEAEGGICVAKANLDAFGHGASTENSDFMITKNPHDKSRVSGGSSGGPAAAVILDMAPFAIGTDTGGSIRLPAAFCGAVGYKPTYGLVSRSGVVAMASSTDTIGPITKSVEESALILDVMAGRDKLDSTTIERDKSSYVDLVGNLKGVSFGVIEEYFGEGIDPGIKESINKSIEIIKSRGAKVQTISLPSLLQSLACYYIICPAEISSNLSRYDGQRFGFSHKSAKTLDESYNWSRSEGFGKEAKRRIMIGAYVLSSGYYDAYYKKAQRLRTKLINEFENAFKKVDFLIGPTSPTTAFKIGEKQNNPLQMYLTDVMTVAASLAGIPAISLPSALIQDLPVGLQIMAPQKKDRELLGIAHEVEKII